MSETSNFHYEIISTGSKGNCVIINDVMIDCGVPFKAIKEYLYDINILLITHIHSDHLRKTTINRIKKMFPHIIIIGNYEVHQKVEGGVDFISNADHPVEACGYKFRPFQCVHDVLVHGFTWEHEGQNIIYATDTNTMKFAPAGEYDYVFLESNYCERKLKEVSNSKYGYDIVAGAHRHLSTQQAKAFYYMNRKDEESKFIELHQSSRFY